MPELSYCGIEVRRHDRERFLAALFTPADLREAVFALLAFNLEIAKTRDVVSEPMLGQIRLQWWREALDGAFAGRPRAHQVVEPLARAIADHALPRAPFDTLIDAREQDLTDEAPPDLDALIAYARDTTAPLLTLWAAVLGETDSTVQQAATAVGVAYGLSGLMRRLPADAARRRITLPTRLVEEVAVDMGEVFELRPHDALARAVQQVCEAGAVQLAAAVALRGQVPRAARPALLSATIARRHLAVLRRSRFDVFDPRVARAAGLLPAQLAWAALRGRY